MRFICGFSLVTNITITSRQRAGPRWEIVLKIFLTVAVESIFFLIRKSDVREKTMLQAHMLA